ncbi:MAG: hypothetical protein KAU12_01825 [Candidatus Omnitrophica bacterium]|nr:hypothetical protein [Candidatus Omnitrophota bacterium]
MLRGRKVKIRLKRAVSEQRVRVFVGTVLDMENAWLKVEGKFYTLAKGETKPRVDAKLKILCIPRESINIIRILPDDLDLNNIKYEIKDTRMMINVGGHEPVSISE